MASLLTSGSMRIVVAGMFDGMASPLLVYRGATILPPLCGGRGPVVHVGRLHVEHVADAAPADAVRELPRDRAPGRAGIGRHEGPAPPEPGEVGVEVLRRHAPERLHEGAEERVDGVDPVDGPPGAVLGVVGRVRGDLELGEDADVGGRPVGRDDRAGRDAAPQRVHGALPRKGAPPRDLEERLVRVVHSGHGADPLARQPASVHLLAAVPGGARHRERPLRVVALERLGEIGLVELAAAAPLDPERGGVGREALDQPVAHGVGGLEADAAAPRAFAQGQHEHEALGVGHPGLLRELARPQDALAAHAEGPAAAPAEVALLAVLRFALLHDRGGPAARAAFDFVGGAGRVVERRRADHVPDGLDSAAALGLAEVRHALLEVEDQVFGVHAAPIIAVYGVNDMAPWGHMYVNPGLTEPFKKPHIAYLGYRLGSRACDLYPLRVRWSLIEPWNWTALLAILLLHWFSIWLLPCYYSFFSLGLSFVLFTLADCVPNKGVLSMVFTVSIVLIIVECVALVASLVCSDFYLSVIEFLMRNYLPYGFIETAQDGSLFVGEWFAQLCLRPLIWISQSPYNALAMTVVAVIAQTFLAIYALFRNMNYYDMNAPFLENFFNTVKGAALKLSTAILGEHAIDVLCKKRGSDDEVQPSTSSD